MLLTQDVIKQIAERSSRVSVACQCQQGLSRGWEALSKTLEASDVLRFVGQVGAQDSELATLDEYHPDGTHFWSEGAPIHFDFYPSNQSSVWDCRLCGRAFIRFTEAGAYHAEQRIRRLTPSLIV